MIISDKLKNILKDSKNPVAKKLLDLETGTETWNSDIDYIDIALENQNKISYITLDRKDRFKVEEVNPTHFWFCEERIPVKLTKYGMNKFFYFHELLNNNANIYGSCVYYQGNGLSYSPNWIKGYNKLLKKYLKKYGYPTYKYVYNNPDYRVKYAYMTTPGKFINKFNFTDITDKDIQEFASIFRNNDLSLKSESLYFDLVEGDDIVKAYHEVNYFILQGSLGSSCMRYSSCIKYIKFYSNNPDVVKLLVLRDLESNKVRGRALVWNCYDTDSQKDVIYMDRIYTDNSNFEDYFKNYAIANNWYYKYRQGYSCDTVVSTEGKYLSETLNVTVSFEDDMYIPYMDSFKSADVNCNELILYNNTDGTYDLQNTNGGPFVQVNTVYSEWEGEDIDEDESIYSDYMSDYIYERHAVELYNGGYIHRDHDDLIKLGSRYYVKEECTYCEYTDEWMLEDYVVYSDWYQSYIPSEESVYSEYHQSELLESECTEYNEDWILDSELETYKKEVEEEIEQY